jgi:hypothetical protein
VPTSELMSSVIRRCSMHFRTALHDAPPVLHDRRLPDARFLMTGFLVRRDRIG